VKRITFYDKDSIPITIVLDELKKKLYLKEIIKDYNHFKDSFQRADLQIVINEINLEDIPDLIISRLDDLNGIAY
jgi:hydroxypyruvate isomerase